MANNGKQTSFRRPAWKVRVKGGLEEISCFLSRGRRGKILIVCYKHFLALFSRYW